MIDEKCSSPRVLAKISSAWLPPQQEASLAALFSPRSTAGSGCGSNSQNHLRYSLGFFLLLFVIFAVIRVSCSFSSIVKKYGLIPHCTILLSWACELGISHEVVIVRKPVGWVFTFSPGCSLRKMNSESEFFQALSPRRETHDLTKLPVLNEEELLKCLKERYTKSAIYVC